MPSQSVTSPQIRRFNKSCFVTYSEFLHARHYATKACDQPSECDKSNLLRNSLQDVIHPASRKNLTSKQKKSRKKLCSEAEKNFEEINKKLLKTRENYIGLFPSPKANLDSVYQNISSHLNQRVSPNEVFKEIMTQVWEYEINLTWPDQKTFTGTARHKQEAANRAALSALIWLQDMKVLNNKGKLSLLSKVNVQEAKMKPVADIKLSSESVSDINYLMEKYSQEVLEYINTDLNVREKEDSENSSENVSDDEELFALQDNGSKSEGWLEQRNESLFRKYNKKMQVETYSLPISSYREEFLQLLKHNRVVVVTGEPGCGKSTQVPQFIFDDYASRMEGTKCKIVVTQPRRISAISLAEYIAQERDEQVGDVTGYQVRFKSVLPNPQGGGIIYCSTGILLRKIINDPGLADVSHVIIDEAHERDINTDFLLALIKRAVELNPLLQVVIMSATINAELFQNYFDNSPALFVPGFTYPVKQQFLDDHMGRELGINDVDEFCESPQPKIDCRIVSKMVSWINSNRPEGAILVFLPGWAEIQLTMKYLKSLNDDRLYIIPVHSKLNNKQQKLIFAKPPSGMRKVILSTNIAETSITINDVVYVVDTGAHKEERLDTRTGVSCLDNHWVSKANVKQRKGRAGRVQAGESFHLYTQWKHDSLEDFPIPEILRVPLEKSVLDCKMYSATKEEIEDFFSQLPEPPGPAAVNKAVSFLQSLGALDLDEDLTPLGKRIYLFTTHPLLSKALVHSVIFKCVNPILTIVTLMSAEYPVFMNIMENKEAVKTIKQRFSPCSDHMALAWLFHQWEQYRKQGSYHAETFCKDRMISSQNMLLTHKLRSLHGGYLYKSKLLEPSIDYSKFDEECNTFARNDEFVKGVLLSGLGKVLTVRNFKLMKGRMKHCNDLVTQTGQSGKVNGDSVNHGRKTYPSPFLTYYRAVSSLERPVMKIWDTSIVSPICLLLFLPGIISIKTMKNSNSSKAILSIKGPTPINMTCDIEQAELLLNLRQVMWTVVEYLVENEGHPTDNDQYEVVSKFRDNMLQVISKLASEQGEYIDYTEDGDLRIQPLES